MSYRLTKQERTIRSLYPEPPGRWYDAIASPCAEGLTARFRDIAASKSELQGSLDEYRSLFGAMPRGGRLAAELARAGAEAVATFADQGEGILPDALARIGQPFFTTKDKGTGLGLAVGMTILESHRGAATFESELGRGTTVTARLPLLPASHG